MSSKGRPLNPQSRLNPSLPRGSLAVGQIAQWSGATWTPIDLNATITTVITGMNLTGTVTDVDISLPKEMDYTKTTVAGVITFTLVYTTEAANLVFAGPVSGAAAIPGFRAMVAADLNALAGTYTPTLTNVANLSASTAYECQYMRVGSVVTVSGRVDIDPILAATSTQLGISLPVASNIGAVEDCAGTAFASGIAAQGAAILGDATNDRAQLQYVAGDITNQAMYFTFTYQVV